MKDEIGSDILRTGWAERGELTNKTDADSLQQPNLVSYNFVLNYFLRKYIVYVICHSYLYGQTATLRTISSEELSNLFIWVSRNTTTILVFVLLKHPIVSVQSRFRVPLFCIYG